MNRKELVEHIHSQASFLCVGLDTDPMRLPACLKNDPDGVVKFNRDIIDATARWCVAYKPNTAFYEAQGPEGWEALQQTVDYIRTNYPRHFIIADAKRADIGNTSGLYARAFFDRMGVDAVTCAPYMGSDSVKPFLNGEGRWVILLALTSNPGSHDFQLIRDEATGRRLFEQVIVEARGWTAPADPDECLMFVVGATRGELFTHVRRVAPRAFLLVPGVGAQGGSLEEVVRYGKIADGSDVGLLVNASRSIIYASGEHDFAAAAEAEALRLRDTMARLI